MKRELEYKLQMFSEEGEAAGEETSNETTSTEEKADAKEDEKTYTQDEVNKMIDDVVGKKFAKWEEKKEKEISEAQKLAEMNAQERAEHERDELQKELDGLKAERTIAEMRGTARKMCQDAGIAVPDELLNPLVTNDAEKTKGAVSAFVELFKKALNDGIETGVKERLKGTPPKKSDGSTTITKDEIMAIKNPALRKQKIAENIDLFK